MFYPEMGLGKDVAAQRLLPEHGVINRGKQRHQLATTQYRHQLL
jgi:hypothetical protein